MGRPFKIVKEFHFTDGTVERWAIEVEGENVQSFHTPYTIEQLEWYRSVRNGVEATGALPYEPGERRLYLEIDEYARNHRLPCLGGG